nr:RNA-directed DNA polymerase, eukaryota, reverse transcriptase zinc-binding domain protein [Tanacetum cinerariifolium]
MHIEGRAGQQFLDLLCVLQGIDWSENKDGWRCELDQEGEYLGWRIRMDRLPTQEKLDQKGIDLPFILCPMCNTKDFILILGIKKEVRVLFVLQYASVTWWSVHRPSAFPVTCFDVVVALVVLTMVFSNDYVVNGGTWVDEM